MKLLAVDVDYRPGKDSTGKDTPKMAVAAGVLFRNWEDEHSGVVFLSELRQVEDYVPGAFYRRELPCILKLLKEHRLDPDCIVVDGYVVLDGAGKPGLGQHLFDALEGRATVIGVAKKPFKGIPSRCEVYRGKSKKPLFVTSAGLDLATAKQCIETMHGNFRLPTLLKEADRACRGTRGRE